MEGSYSTNPYDGEVRINEFKKLVRKYNEAGINIIMDVVYNHVYAAVGCNFDVLMPGYYFRYVKDRVFSNGSGCGNETASEMPMFRKFMIDSVLFWAKEYKIAGFRFDLMAIHDLETMNELAKKVHEYNPNIVLFGEPWMADRSTLPPEKAAHKGNANKYKGYGFFSDSMRDSLVRTSKDIRSDNRRSMSYPKVICVCARFICRKGQIKRNVRIRIHIIRVLCFGCKCLVV